jgi:3-oxoacyl-[acyl-carrier-protein] synthase II
LLFNSLLFHELSTMTKRRVVITGLGVVSPVGIGTQNAWVTLLKGQSGITRITKFDPSAFSSQIAGEVKNFNVEDYLPAKDARRMDTFIQYGLVAGIEAFKDSGLEVTEQNAERIGVSIGSGIGGLGLIESTNDNYDEGGPRKISPFFIPGTIINMISGNLSIMFGLKGPNVAIVTACTTGTHSIGDAARMIEYGDADVMVAGGAEAAITELSVGGFASARALSNRNDDPTTASRPWDKDRDGFVIGEGAGVMVLEEYEHAKARGARIYAELSGYGMSADAFHMTAPNMDGPRRSMVNALKNAGINPTDVQFMNAHGTSTPLGDTNETNAIKATFNDHAYKLVVNSTKSMTGHLLGGAGGLESVFTVLSIYNQVSPPTINIFNQDPECDLDYCANTARDLKITYALKNNFGFGGTNGSLVFKKI